jgi:hypothetical protein
VVLAAIGVDPDEGRSAGPLRLLIVILFAVTFSLLALGVLAFALEGKDLSDPAPVVVDAGPPPVDDSPLGPLVPDDALLRALEPVVAACHLSASPRDPALRAEVRVSVEVRGRVVALGDATGASPFFHGCLTRRGAAVEAPKGLRGAVELVGRVEGGRASLSAP